MTTIATRPSGSGQAGLGRRMRQTKNRYQAHCTISSQSRTALLRAIPATLTTCSGRNHQTRKEATASSQRATRPRNWRRCFGLITGTVNGTAGAGAGPGAVSGGAAGSATAAGAAGDASGRKRVAVAVAAVI